MAKIHFRIVRKKYKDSVYEHEEASITFPKELHDLLRCLRGRQLMIKASREGKTTIITLIELE